MFPALRHRALYAAFDRFPSRKGSAIHIDRFARALFEQAGGGLLYVLGDEDLPAYQREGDVEIVRYMRAAEHVLERAAGFGERLDALLEELPELELAHFRDPWAACRWSSAALHDGLRGQRAAVDRAAVSLPGVPQDVLDTSRARGALPGAGRRDHRARRVTARARARHPALSATAPTSRAAPAPPPRPRRYLLYFGALQPWQGVDTALRAFARLQDLDLDLVICASVHPRRAKPYRKLAEKLEVDRRVLALPALRARARPLARARDALARAAARLLPQRPQGCAPLKILESHASGTPAAVQRLTQLRIVSKGKPEHLTRLNAGSIRPVDAVTGACFALRTTLWRELGGFDAGYVNGCRGRRSRAARRGGWPAQLRRPAQYRTPPHQCLARTKAPRRAKHRAAAPALALPDPRPDPAGLRPRVFGGGLGEPRRLLSRATRLRFPAVCRSCAASPYAADCGRGRCAGAGLCS